MRFFTGLVSAALVPLLVAPAMAVSRPSSIPLPDDFQPEGIAVGEGTTFYVGSLRDGDIYRGDLHTGDGEVWADVTGRVSVGMRVDEGRRLARRGRRSDRSRLGLRHRRRDDRRRPRARPARHTFSNDVAITRDALYFTDTFAPTIYKVPIGADGSFGATEPITVTGPAAATGGFGLNGIDSTHRGPLIVNHTALGILALVDPDTGVSTAIPLSGPPLVPARSTGCSSRVAPPGWCRTSTTPWPGEAVARPDERQGRRGDQVRPVPGADHRRPPRQHARPGQRPVRPRLPAAVRPRGTSRHRLRRGADQAVNQPGTAAAKVA